MGRLTPFASRVRAWEIRRRYERGEATQQQLAAVYDISQTAVQRATRRATAPDYCGLTPDMAARVDAAGVDVATGAYLITTYATHTAAEQAAALNTTSGSVRSLRYRLIRTGILNKEASRQKRNRSAVDDPTLRQRVILLAADGVPIRTIARLLGQPKSRIGEIATGAGVYQRAKTVVYTARGTARRMGVCPKVVLTWIDRGWLRAELNERTPAKETSHTHWRIARADLAAFVRDCRTAWPTYAVATVADADLRALAQARRGHAGGRWLSMTDLARLMDATYG
jgi:hypothetical protein